MLKDSPLAQKTVYKEHYSPELLFPVPRSLGRERLALGENLPFQGEDFWNGFEFSWLNLKGKPLVGLIELAIPATTPNIVESKSLKLYLNSFCQTRFSSYEEVLSILERDLTEVIGGPLSIQLLRPEESNQREIREPEGICIDSLEIETHVYQPDPLLLQSGSPIVEEKLYSHLLKSNCLATGQPDWGSVMIHYKGPKIDHSSLLKYIISYRRHAGFAEHCTEKFYMDLMERCEPEKLFVYIRYTKRGGLDINPYRSNFACSPPNGRLLRQ